MNPNVTAMLGLLATSLPHRRNLATALTRLENDANTQNLTAQEKLEFHRAMAVAALASGGASQVTDDWSQP